MTTIRLFSVLLFLKAQICYGQSHIADSVFNKFKTDIQIEQREHAGIVVMDDETKISYYLLLSNCSIKDLIRYTDDSSAFIRSYAFAGLLRKEISQDELLKILDRHANDTAKFINQGADVVTEWTVKEFMQEDMALKSANKLHKIDYKKQIERIRNESIPQISFGEVHHELIEKSELLRLDSLVLTEKKLRIVAFTIFIAGKELKSSSSLLTNDMKSAIAQAKPGDVLYIDDIEAAIEDNSNSVRKLIPVRLKLL